MKRSGCSGAMNVFWLLDMGKDLCDHILNGAPVAVTGGEMVLAACVGVVKSGVLMYQYLFNGTINSRQFWTELSATWAEVAGAVLGAKIGAQFGAFCGLLLGPVGAVLGALIGGLLGAMIGRIAGRSVIKGAIDWKNEGTEEDLEHVKTGMVMCAMAKLELAANDLPSTLTIATVRKNFRRQALSCHPDKTGLLAKTTLTKEEQHELATSMKKFHDLQHDCEVVEAFVNNRNKMTPADLQHHDYLYRKLQPEKQNLMNEVETKFQNFVAELSIKEGRSR